MEFESIMMEMAKKEKPVGSRKRLGDKGPLTPSEVEVALSSPRAEKSLRVHQAIVRVVSRLSKPGAPAVHVSKIAAAAKKDPRTVSRHLEILRRHHRGYFLDDEHRVFAPRAALKEYLEAEAEREQMELMSASRSSAGRLLDQAED